VADPTSRRLAAGSAFRTINLIASIVVSFFLTPFVIHTLGDRLNGFWILVGALISYYGLLDLGMSSAVRRHLAGALGRSDQEECGRVFSAALQIYLILGALTMVITLVLAGLAPIFFHDPADSVLFSKVIIILGTGMALTFPFGSYVGLLEADLRFDILAMAGLGWTVLRAGVTVWALLAGYKVVALAWVAVLSGFPRIAVFVFFVKKYFPWLKFSFQRWRGGTTKTLFSYSIFTFIGSMADQLRFNTDSLVITAFVGLSAVTHFNIAAAFMQHYINLMISVVAIFAPLFSQLEGAGDRQRLERVFFFASKMSIYVGGFIGFGLIAWGKPFIQRWIGTAYLDAYPCLVVLTIGWIMDLSQIPSNNLLYAVSKHKFYAVWNSIEAVANLFLSLWLVKSFGILGVALGTCIPMIMVKLLVQPIYVCRACSVLVGEYTRKALGAVLAACSSLILPVLITLMFSAPVYTRLVTVGLVCFVIYGGTLWLFHLTDSDRDVLSRSLLPARLADRLGGLVASLR